MSNRIADTTIKYLQKLTKLVKDGESLPSGVSVTKYIYEQEVTISSVRIKSAVLFETYGVTKRTRNKPRDEVSSTAPEPEVAEQPAEQPDLIEEELVTPKEDSVE